MGELRWWGDYRTVSLEVGSLGDAPKINEVPGVFGEVPSKEPGSMSVATRQSSLQDF